jgi:transposase
LNRFFRRLAVWDERANGRCGGLSRQSAYLLRGGLPWRMLPPCFPLVSTVRRWFYLWRDNGLWLSLNHALLLIGREAIGREASPSAGVIETKYGEATAKA